MRTSATSLAGTSHDLAVSLNKTGKIEVFAVDKTGGLSRKQHNPPGGSASSQWNGIEATLGSGRITRLATAPKLPDDSTNMFAIGTDGKLHHLSQRSASSTWRVASIGGSKLIDLSVVHHGNSQFSVYTVDGNGKVARFSQSPDQSWTQDPLTGPSAPIRKLATVTDPDGSMEVLALGVGGRLWTHRSSDGEVKWSSPFAENISIRDMAALSQPNSPTEIFVIGSSGGLYHSSRLQGQGDGNRGGDWQRLRGIAAGSFLAVAAARRGDGSLGAFVLGADRTLSHIWRNSAGAWTVLGNLGGSYLKLATVANSEGHTEVFATGCESSQEIYHIDETLPPLDVAPEHPQFPIKASQGPDYIDSPHVPGDTSEYPGQWPDRLYGFYIITYVTIGADGLLRARTNLSSNRRPYDFEAVVAVTLLDKDKSKLWTTTTQHLVLNDTHRIDLEHEDTARHRLLGEAHRPTEYWISNIPPDVLVNTRYVAIVHKSAKQPDASAATTTAATQAITDIGGWIDTLARPQDYISLTELKPTTNTLPPADSTLLLTDATATKLQAAVDGSTDPKAQLAAVVDVINTDFESEAGTGAALSDPSSFPVVTLVKPPQ